LGTLFGLLAGAALHAPPELAYQPPPWDHWALKPATHMTGAGPAPVTFAPAQPASPAPVAAGSDPAPVAQAPVLEAMALPAVVAPEPTPQPATFAQPSAKGLKVSRASALKARSVQIEEPAVDTSVAGAGPASSTTHLEPEAPRAPAEYALPRSEGEFIDLSR
jgi:hypothetical protein